MRNYLRFRRDTRGVAALEFALVAPLLVTMLIGVTEATSLVRAQMKLNHAAGLLGKMVAQQTALVTNGTTNTLGNLCYGAGMAMAPLPATSFASAVASVTNTSSNGTQMDWESDTSCATTATKIGAAAAVALATTKGLVPDVGDSVIIVEVSYVYTASSHLIMPASKTMTQTIYVRPRANATIACSNC